jgi:hypothetical protein
MRNNALSVWSPLPPLANVTESLLVGIMVGLSKEGKCYFLSIFSISEYISEKMFRIRVLFVSSLCNQDAIYHLFLKGKELFSMKILQYKCCCK